MLEPTTKEEEIVITPEWRDSMLAYYADDIEMERPAEDGEFTALEFVDLVKNEGTIISVKKAQSWLAKAVREERATMRVWKNERGSKTNLYKWVGDER